MPSWSGNWTGKRPRRGLRTGAGLLFRAFALALLPWSALAPAAVAAPAASVAYGDLDQPQRVAVIQGLVAEGDFAKAQLLLSNSRFDEGDLGYQAAFLQAVIWRNTGELAKAEALLRQIVSERPAYARVRLELATVLAKRGNRSAATYHLRLLADSAADPGSRRRFESFIDQVDPQRPLSFSGFVSIAPSTNINNGSSTDTFFIGGLPFEINRNGQATSGIGLRAGGSMVFNHALSESLSAYVATSAVVSEYSGRSFDTLTGDMRFGLRHSGLSRTVSAEMILDRRMIEWKPVDWAVGGRLFLRQPLGPRFLMSGEVQYVDRSYDNDPNSATQTWTGRARLLYAFHAAASVYGEVGVANERMGARSHHSYDGGHLEIGARGELPYGINAGIALRAGGREYETPFPGSPNPRSDRFFDVRTTFLKRDLAYRGFTPQLGLGYYRQKSNVALYDFDRYSVDLTLTKSF